MPSTYLSRNISAGSTGKKFTLSAWIKFTSLSTNSELWSISNDNTVHNYIDICFKSGVLDMQFKLANGGTFMRRKTTRLFRDVNAWYHIVLRFDSTNSTASDRFRLYVNGVQETSFDNDGTASTFPSDYVTALSTSGANQFIGRTVGYSSYWDGSMSHFHLCDGYSYAPTVFGSTDSTTGEWKINTSPSITMGTNGFTILKDGNTITDQSSNSNNFSLGAGTLTKTEDNPSNVFATLNPLHIQGTTSRSITYGNTRFYTTTTAWGSALSTLGFSSGKFYVEAKILTLNSSTGYGSIAIQDINAFGSSGNTNANLNGNNASAGLSADYRSGQSAIYSSGSTVSSNVGDFSNNDIIGMAIDMDNKALYIHKNGTYYQIGGVTGVPTSGASKTGAITIPTSVETCAIGLGSYTSNADFCYNFGNGYFLSTAVASAGTNASGIGIFEHDVPANFTALSTKGLNL